MLLYAFLITPYSLILRQLLPEFLLPRKVHTFLDLTNSMDSASKEAMVVRRCVLFIVGYHPGPFGWLNQG